MQATTKIVEIPVMTIKKQTTVTLELSVSEAVFLLGIMGQMSASEAHEKIHKSIERYHSWAEPFLKHLDANRFITHSYHALSRLNLKEALNNLD